eukprot:9720888-Heterocapsa_arctica.AAC.1
MSPAMLANDMMIFYAPKELYTLQVSVLELICASVCLTSMICFSLEVKYGNLFDTTVHMQRHRVGARGNATSFPMPWQDLLVQLQNLEAEGGEPAVAPDLPRTGRQLADA